VFKSVKAPIAVIVTLSITVVATILLGFAIKAHEALYLELAQSHAESLASSVVEHITSLEKTNDNEVGQPAFAYALLDEDPLAIQVYDKHYALRYQQPETEVANLAQRFFETDEPSRFPEGVYHHNGIVVAQKRIGTSLFPRGYLFLFNDVNAPLSDSKKTFLKNALPLVLLVWLASVVVSLLVINRLFRPLASLTSFTQKVSETKDYALRQNFTSRNEIGELGDNINRLLEVIEIELLINHEQKQTLVDQQETMIRLANYDSLTGLPNRQFVLDHLKLELARAKRNNEDLILLFFDLDGFKGINDSLGHETGDLILIEVADRVSILLRDGDLVARLGGDEFLVLPDRNTRETSVEHMAARLIAAFADPFELRGLSLSVGVSVGVASAIDANYDLSELMSNADLAMYRSKARGRGSFTIFTPDMVESHKRKLHIANAIEQGLVSNEFLVYYQVKVDKAGSVIGLEALARWQHPEYGLIMPSEFIPIAEQGGKISAITRWVIEKVSIDLPTMTQWLGRRYRVSINLSGHDLRNRHLFDNIYAIFSRHNVNPEYVEFEVTESTYLENFALSNKFFSRMSNMGCAIALDDFGTGYSSLSYLTQISIDTLKIDRQFIHELETSERSRLVTGAIIDLAKRLSLDVCAEGIENQYQWTYLIEHDCDYAQGFMFSKPVPLHELITTPSHYDITTLPQRAKRAN